MPDAGTIEDIRAVVRTHVEGMCQNDPEKLRAAFHERACSIGHFEGALEWEDRAGFIALVAAAVDTPDPTAWHEVNSINCVGDIATVQVENIFEGGHYDDILTLLKHDGRWMIVAKAFRLRPAP